jgi:hypothetical protein
MKEEAKGQEADNNATFTGNWPEVVYTLTAETRFAETSIPICRFLIFLLVFLQRICFSGRLLSSMQLQSIRSIHIGKTGNTNIGIRGGSTMEKFRLLGVLCIGAIALVSASTHSNDPLASSLLNTVFIISCGVIGLWLLHKTNLSGTLRVRQTGSRRFDLPVEFPLTDSRNVTVIQDRRRLADRRKVINGFVDQKGILTKMTSN